VCLISKRAQMSKVEVFRVKIYDGMTDDYVTSRRMATLEGVAIMRGTIIGSGILIDDSELEEGEQWTRLDFKATAPSRDSKTIP
jgi:hypothetical protein